MLYREVADFYEKVEATTKRLEITALLVDMLRNASCDEIANVVYMTHGRLFPDFYPEKIGMAEKMAIRTLSTVCRMEQSKVEAMWKQVGDAGLLGEQMLRASSPSGLGSEALTVNEVHDSLSKMALSSGPGSQEMYRMQLKKT